MRTCQDCGINYSDLCFHTGYEKWCEDCFDKGLLKDIDDHFKNSVKADLKECTNSNCEMYPYYGLAPHWSGITKATPIGSTLLKVRLEWPESFIPDKDAEGMGTYYCPVCFAKNKEQEAAK